MKTFTGVVVSAKMAKTVVVEVGRVIIHPIYKKRMKRSSRIKAHTDQQLVEGQTVKIVETKPISKQKYFKVIPL